MEQLFNKAITLGKSQYVKLAKSLIPCSETSLSYKEIMGLAVDILLDSPTFQQTQALSEALEAEDYERAAKLRDELRQLDE